MGDYIEDLLNERLGKGIDREEAEEEDDDFNPANHPENIESQPHARDEWEEDYDREEEQEEEDDE